MNWITNLLFSESVAQTILILCIVVIIGLALGQIKIGKISFGSSFVFFAAIAFGHFAGKAGISVNQSMLDLAKNFGLVVFVYTLGLQVGPGFFNSLRKGGLKLNLSATGVIILGSALTLAIAKLAGLRIPESIGVLSGAVTNTPSLIAAQQTVLDINPEAVDESYSVASAYAVGYPVSVLCVMIGIIILSRFFSSSARRSTGTGTDIYTAVEEVHVCNPDLYGKTVKDIVSNSGFHFVISRVWRNGGVQIPVSDTVIEQDDHLLLICSKEDIHKLGDIFGDEEQTDWNRPDIDWNIIDKNLVSRHLRVTKDNIVGLSLGKLKLRNKFGVNITRINRAGITLVPNAGTVLQFGDRLTVVGDEEKIKALGKVIGDEEKRLDEPHLIPLLTGILLGVVLGSIPVAIPGMSTPLKLGLAGGPIIVGILMGAFGNKAHINVYTTRAVNLMLRQMGITFFFASLGFGVGGSFVDTVFCAQGLKWAGFAVILSLVPMLIMGIFNDKILHLDFHQNMGLICGAYTNPNALSYVNDMLGNDNAAEAYATVYPLTCFLRVFIAQILIILTI